VSKPREFRASRSIKGGTVYAWEVDAKDEHLNELISGAEEKTLIEKPAYDKAVEALKRIESTNIDHEDRCRFEHWARETLKELGEI